MKTRVGATVGLVAVLVLAACSSTKTSSSGSGTSSGSTGASSPGVTATEIHVGALEYKAFFGDASVGAQARIKRLNDAGGVYGRKIIIDNTLDDGQDNSTDLNAAKTLVEQDHEFALVPVMTAAWSAADYMEQQKVPYFGWSIQPTWCFKQYGFGFEGNDCDPSVAPKISNAVTIEQKLLPGGTAQGKTVAFMSEDNNSAQVALQNFALGWKAVGAKVVLSDSSLPSPPAVTGDYTPYAQKVMTANNGKPADAFVMSMSVSNTLGMYKKLNQLGYKGLMQDFTLYDPRLASTTTGLVTQLEFSPFESAATVPAVAQMVSDLKAADPNAVLSQPVAAGYWSMDLFIAMLQKVGPNLTRQAFENVANHFSYDNHGGSPPVTFPAAHTSVTPCFSFVRSNGKNFDVHVPPEHHPQPPAQGLTR
jgi:ABC-type branched-subunit amino acid transport system substrate-binding protein